MKKGLLLPAITGQIGQWRFYEVVMSIGDIVSNFGTSSAPDYLIKTVEEVEEIYSKKGVSNLLQRAFEQNRLEPIKNYIIHQPDKYINNLTVAIFGGDPDWESIDVALTIQSLKTDENTKNAFTKAFGIIKLSGEETLFVLDGQHRLKGLREAIHSDGSLATDTIAITLIIHQSTESGKERTRRLFSTINRHAKPVSKGENILLDEDDLSAIITRKLIEDFKPFKDKEVIAQNKTTKLYENQYDTKFSTVLELYTINEVLLDNSEIYSDVNVRIRPEDDIIISQTKLVFAFWEKFLKLFPPVTKFLHGDKSVGNSRKKGGYYFMRPIGQKIIADLYKHLDKQGLKTKMDLVVAIPQEIDDVFWHHILWNPSKGTIIQGEALARNYLFYHFGLKLSATVENKMKASYRKNAGDDKLPIPKKLDLLGKAS